MRRAGIEASKHLLRLVRAGHHITEGCASVGEFGERYGASAMETRQLLAMARAIEHEPAIERMVSEGVVPTASAALLYQVYAHPELRRPGDDWRGGARTLSVAALRRKIGIRREEARVGRVVTIVLHVSEHARDDFERALVIASRKAKRMLSPAEAFERVVSHYLDDYDLERKEPGTRRVPDTSTVNGRYVPA